MQKTAKVLNTKKNLEQPDVSNSVLSQHFVSGSIFFLLLSVGYNL